VRERGDRSVGQLARDFELTETAVREWVKQAARDAGTRQDGGLTTVERQELVRLRRECRQLCVHTAAASALSILVATTGPATVCKAEKAHRGLNDDSEAVRRSYRPGTDAQRAS